MKYKLLLEFDDTQRSSALDALRVQDYKCVLWDLDQELRSAAKYQGDEHARRWLDRLHAHLADNDVSLDN